jgi:hypothetical protein
MRPRKNGLRRILRPAAVVLVIERRAACEPCPKETDDALARYTTKPEHAAENEALSRAVFAQLRGAPPRDVAYALLRDGNDFIHVFLNLKADERAPVTELRCPGRTAFRELPNSLMNS